jgi:hypothetical protein
MSCVNLVLNCCSMLSSGNQSWHRFDHSARDDQVLHCPDASHLEGSDLPASVTRNDPSGMCWHALYAIQQGQQSRSKASGSVLHWLMDLCDDAMLQDVQLLPVLLAPATPPPQLFWQQPGAVHRQAVAGAAAAVLSAGCMSRLVPVLLATSSSYPRLHPVWGCLLALIIPGFVPIKVWLEHGAATRGRGGGTDGPQ